MKCKIRNNSDISDKIMGELSPLIDDLANAVQKRIKFKSMPDIFLQDDKDNADILLGKTAYYDPQNQSITIYVTNRHPKDILRSVAHELIHHGQNLRGEFDDMGNVGEGYAQNDEHLRNMEKEAYLKGNMCFRDWEDGYKRQMMESIHRQNSFKRRNTTMKIHKWKNNELNKLLMEKFNFGDRNTDEEETESLEESSCSANRDDEEEKEEIVNEDMGKAEEELKAKIKQAEDAGDEKKAEDLRRQLQQMGGYMEEAKKPPFDNENGKDEKCDYVDCEDEGDKKNESFRRDIRKLVEEILKLK